MTKKNWVLIAAMLVLATVYVVYFTDWFRAKVIVIHHVSREMGNSRRNPGAPQPLIIPVTFGLEKTFRLTEIKVVELAGWQTNQDTLPLWHLISDSNSVPVKMFRYGQNLRGMKPSVPGTRPSELQPGVTYRLFLVAGSAKGQHDFQPVAAPGGH